MNSMSIAKRAIVQSGFMVVAGLGLLIFLRHRGPGASVLVMAGVVAFCGLLAPKAFLALEGWVRALARITGSVLTWVLLTVLYAIYFVPGRLALFVLRKDPLCRRMDPDARTYWSVRRRRKDAQAYRRQY